MAMNLKTYPAVMATKDAALYLGVSEQYLNTDRHIAMQNGTAPVVPYVRIGARMVRYRKADLDAFLEQSRVGG